MLTLRLFIYEVMDDVLENYWLVFNDFSVYTIDNHPILFIPLQIYWVLMFC